MRAILLAFLVVGCTAPGPLSSASSQADLAAELDGRVAGAPESCVSTSASQGLRVVDSRTLVHHSGRTVWVNRLAGDCPGLRPLDTVIVEVRGAQYCRGDRVRGLSPGTTIPGPVCPLGDFIPYRLPR
jgi:hypothetical protein